MNAEPTYRETLRRLLELEALPAHKFGHQPRLYSLCRKIGEDLVYDDDIVFAAVWLHDLGVFVGNRPAEPEELKHWDHVHYAVRRGGELLAATDFPREKIAPALQVIREHQPGDVPGSIESIIVRDADILEQLGAIGILRTAAKLGSDTRFHRFADARDHLQRQLEALPHQLRVPRSRDLAQSRIALLTSFLQGLAAEAGSELG